MTRRDHLASLAPDKDAYLWGESRAYVRCETCGKELFTERCWTCNPEQPCEFYPHPDAIPPF